MSWLRRCEAEAGLGRVEDVNSKVAGRSSLQIQMIPFLLVPLKMLLHNSTAFAVVWAVVNATRPMLY